MSSSNLNTDQGFTFIWKIENFSFCWEKEERNYSLDSPEFKISKIRALDKVRWYLSIKPWKYGSIGVDLYRSHDKGPRSCNVNFQLSLLGADGNRFCDEYGAHYFTKGKSWGTCSLAKRNDVLEPSFSPQDTLTVSCHILNSHWKPKQSQRCTAKTHMMVERNIFIWTIGNFFSFAENQSKNYIVQSPKTNESLLSIEFIPSYIGDEIAINIQPNTSRIPYIAEVGLSLIGRGGLCLDLWKGSNKFLTNDKWMPVLFGKKTQLLTERDQYLSNNVLTLRCECVVSGGMGSSYIEEVVNGSPTLLNTFSFYLMLSTIPCAVIPFTETSGTQTRETVAFQTPEQSDLTFRNESHESLVADFHSLLLDQSFADLKIQVGEEIISAHRAVLSARSSVFKAMLTSGMKEASASLIEIEDLDFDTVQRMLLYMYTDTIGDLLWESAMNLYVAADKYDIGSLKKRCSAVLSSSFHINNVCHILSLANRHADEELKEAARNFIYSLDTVIIGTSEWENFMKRDTLLAAEVMKWMYLKNAACE